MNNELMFSINKLFEVIEVQMFVTLDRIRPIWRFLTDSGLDVPDQLRRVADGEDIRNDEIRDKILRNFLVWDIVYDKLNNNSFKDNILRIINTSVSQSQDRPYIDNIIQLIDRSTIMIQTASDIKHNKQL